ncbi:alpha-hydroxy acid oxidase [Streptomyces sp. NPDC047000]|uniref:alpha-hydroxy acid oxidase n=1 Tax=Streptomyces sp. NPDC047000 TaxID=3155474 RepID=UPI0033D16DB6
MEPLTIYEYGEQARVRLPAEVWDFVQGGSGTESTLAADRAALDRLRLRPRVLVDVSAPDARTTVLGAPLSFPLGIAPMAYHRLASPDGETATARAAGEAGALLTVSMFASRTLEEIAAAARGPLWLQLYWLRRRDVLKELVARAEAAGFHALVLTVDAPRIGRRTHDLRNGFTLPDGVRAVNLDPDVMTVGSPVTAGSSVVQQHASEQFDPAVTWDDLAWLRQRTTLPLVLKGILTAEDARLAVAHGVDAVVVSTHGGRQLDSATAGVHALPEVVDAVDGACEVLVDGGIRHGTDILKALALGARAALVGRPVLWGLAHSGHRGVRGVLRLLHTELEDAMALSGCPRLDDIGPALVGTAHVT